MPLSDEQIIQSIGDDLPVGIWVARAPGGELVYANSTFAQIMGMTARSDVAVGEYAAPYGIYARSGELYPEDRMPFVLAIKAGETVLVDDIVIHRVDGRRVSIRAEARPVRAASGEISHVVIAFIDITREVEAESRLRAAQRMESIGTLAGGIAHDFNNLLAVIQLVGSTLKAREKDPDKREALLNIERATESGVQLSRALLGFARQGKNLAVPVSLNEVVRGVSQIVERTLGARIKVTSELLSTQDVSGDHSQLEQVVMNLVMNGRDAIEGNGLLALRTRDEGSAVVLEVADTGSGIPADLRERVFEPYFTTKPGVGTGLGLATVFGIVTSHGGTIEALDNAERGTLMRARFPAVGPSAAQEAAPAPKAQLQAGGGALLIVDDEPLVRQATARGLSTLGYQTLLAASGAEAVEIFRTWHGRLEAVVLDLSMPEMDGRATYAALRQIDAAVPVILTSGYALNEEAQRVLDMGAIAFLSKPYDLSSISEALARATAR